MLELQFSEWLLVENGGMRTGIFVRTDRGEEEVLTASGVDSYIKEFNYQDDNSYSTWVIIPRASVQVGYATFGYRARYVQITKENPFEGGADVAFTEGLVTQLRGSGYKTASYRVGESEWISAMNHNLPDDQKLKQLEIPWEEVPDAQQKPTNQVNVPGTKTISVSKPTGSYTLFLGPYNEISQFTIKRIIDAMKMAAKPLIDNDLIEFYEVRSRTGGGMPEEQVFSKSGKKTDEDYTTSFHAFLSQLKYLGDVFLEDYPKTKAKIQKRIKAFVPQDVPSKNSNLNIKQMRAKIHMHFANDIELLFFIHAVEQSEKEMFDLLESMMDFNEKHTEKYSWGVNPYYALLLLNADVSEEKNSGSYPLEVTPQQFWDRLQEADVDNFFDSGFLNSIDGILKSKTFWEQHGLGKKVDYMKRLTERAITKISEETENFRELPRLVWGFEDLARIAVKHLELPEEIANHLKAVHKRKEDEHNLQMKRRSLRRSLGDKFVEGEITPQKARSLLNKYLGKGTEPPEKGREVKLDADHWLLRSESGKYSVEIR